MPKIGEKFGGVSEETKKKIGSYHKGKTLSKAQKEAVSKSSRLWHQNNEHPMAGKDPWNKGKDHLKGKLNPMYGILRSEKWKSAHSERAKKANARASKHHKSKVVLDLSTGIYYDCVRQAKEYATNFSYPYLKQMLNGSRENKTTLMYV